MNDREGIKGRGKGGKEQEAVGVYRGSAGVCHGVTQRGCGLFFGTFWVML